MSNIIVVFPKKEIATNIRNILVRIGFDVLAVTTTGAQALHYVDTLDDGVIVCGYRLSDMMYSDIRDYLPDSFQLLLIASADKWGDGLEEGVVGLPMPIKVYDLVNTLEMILQTMRRRRKKRREALKNRDPKQREIINQAKGLLMERNGMTEEEAHRYLQKNSMDTGTSMIETAQMILTIMSE